MLTYPTIQNNILYIKYKFTFEEQEFVWAKQLMTMFFFRKLATLIRNIIWGLTSNGSVIFILFFSFPLIVS